MAIINIDKQTYTPSDSEIEVVEVSDTYQEVWISGSVIDSVFISFTKKDLEKMLELLNQNIETKDKI